MGDFLNNLSILDKEVTTEEFKEIISNHNGDKSIEDIHFQPYPVDLLGFVNDQS